MGINIEYIINEIKFDQKLISVFDKYNKYINNRLDYIVRTSITTITHTPDELNHNVDHNEFDPSQRISQNYNNSNNSLDNITKMREELKTLTKVVNLKRKELSNITIQEDGLKNNIKQLEDIISIKKNYISETARYAEVRWKAREKVEKEYNRTNKKYIKIVSQLNKSKTNYGNGSSKDMDYRERTNNRRLRYEDKIKKMNDIIKIASDSTEKLLQYQIELQTSNDRLKIFYDQLNNHIKNRQEISLLLIQNEKRINQLKINLSNLGVLTSIEKIRVNTSSSNLIENDNLKKEFLDLQNMRNEILSSRPRGMFNPKYQKENNLFKEDNRKYLENDEVIDSIDYLIELKNNMCNKDTNLLHFIQTNSNETKIFWKCLSTLNIDELNKLLVHYFIKVVDLKESGRENDEIISKLDATSDRLKHKLMSLNNDFQEFHLSIEKQFMELKKHYQSKLNTLFQHIQEDNNSIRMFKMRQKIVGLKKKIIELEKLQTVKPKDTPVMPEPQISLNLLEASKSESETISSAKVIYHKNKLKIQKNKSK